MALLPAYLWDCKEEIEQYARDFGLDFFPVVFELVNYDEINEIAAYGGFPNRYPHWRYGMEYEQLRKGYSYGLQKIYEMVINNDPCYAYLMDSNSTVDQKLVMAHVYAHCDFFKNNFSFANTNRKMMDEMANHSTKVRQLIDKLGIEKVEAFIDACLSIDNLIDIYTIHKPKKAMRSGEEDDPAVLIHKLRSKGYMDSFINPREYLEELKKKVEEELEKKKNFPADKERDVMYFLLNYAPLEKWEQDILSIIYEETVYFIPQGQTKIMNEGWATFWHSRIMTQRALNDSEVIDYASHHAGTIAKTGFSLNPYRLGLDLFRNIEDRWNKGRFGKEYEECESLEKKMSWDTKVNLGRDKIFQVRKIYSDVTFIDEFFSFEFFAEQNLFAFDYNKRADVWQIASRQFKDVKSKLLFQLTNFGQPIIHVIDANYKNRGELLMLHQHEGLDLELNWARETLRNVCRIWKRPVNIQTAIDDRPKILAFDGTEYKEQSL